MVPILDIYVMSSITNLQCTAMTPLHTPRAMIPCHDGDCVCSISCMSCLSHPQPHLHPITAASTAIAAGIAYAAVAAGTVYAATDAALPSIITAVATFSGLGAAEYTVSLCSPGVRRQSSST